MHFMCTLKCLCAFFAVTPPIAFMSLFDVHTASVRLSHKCPDMLEDPRHLSSLTYRRVKFTTAPWPHCPVSRLACSTSTDYGMLWCCRRPF